LKKHPDKGGNEEEFKKIINAYEVLGNPHKRLKYDLCLLKNGNNNSAEYIESEKRGTTYQLDEIIGSELVSEIMALLLKELEENDLIREELSEYGQLQKSSSYRVVRQRGSDKEVEPVISFCQNKVRGQTFEEVINRVRKYLEIIRDAYLDKKDVESAIKEIMPSKELLENPPLAKKELDDYEKHNEYDVYYEKLKVEILKQTYKDRREEISRKKRHFYKSSRTAKKQN